MTRERDRIQENTNKYIIKNCPCYESEGAFYNCVNERIEGDCQDCTNCVLKQIVNHCKNIEEYEDDYYTAPILKMLDIQEVE